jgi:hypothetical protein
LPEHARHGLAICLVEVGQAIEEVNNVRHGKLLSIPRQHFSEGNVAGKQSINVHEILLGAALGTSGGNKTIPIV